MKKTLLFGAILAVLSFNLLYCTPTQATETSPNLQDAFSSVLNNTASPAGYNVTNTNQNPESLVASIVQISLSFVGVIFLILIIYSGIRWMTAGGNDQTLDKAKETLRQAIIGLIIIIGAYALSIFIFNSIK